MRVGRTGWKERIIILMFTLSWESILYTVYTIKFLRSISGVCFKWIFIRLNIENKDLYAINSFPRLSSLVLYSKVFPPIHYNERVKFSQKDTRIRGWCNIVAFMLPYIIFLLTLYFPMWNVPRSCTFYSKLYNEVSICF